MKIKRTVFIRSISFLLSIFLWGCSDTSKKIELFQGDFAGVPEAEINKNNIVLKNSAIKTVWILNDKSIQLKEVKNLYTNAHINLENITLFEIEFDNNKIVKNTDFKLLKKLKIKALLPTDSLPTKSLGFSGKEISGDFISNDKNILIRWSALLREGSNYIRQNIEIRTINKPVKISKITFFNGELKGASYAGSVLGSPIVYKNFFFALEHPIAKSKALLSLTLGGVTKKGIDLSNIIDQAGEYVIAVEHGGGSEDFNVHSISLLADNKIIHTDKHLLNGLKGNNLFRLKLKKYNDSKKYSLKVNLYNENKATGALHIYRKTDDVLNFYVDRTDELIPGNIVSEWAVMGVSPKSQKRRAFSYYLERERARPYKQFLHYNCWWDITDDGASSFTSEQLIERMHAWNNKFIQPYDIKLDAFVFDDGWDDLDSIWYFDPIKFPNGFASQAKLCKEYNSGIGVWMSPFGGYLENKRRRVESAKREGLEINGKGLSLAGENYYNRFLERSLDMLNNYKVNYFKYDGFGGSNPKYLPDMEAGTRLIKTLRQNNPDVFINITVGSWPSPFWLKYADCTWRGSGDLHNAGLGSTTQRFITYRDGTLHNNIVNRAPFYPLNSIMTVGIAYANLGHPANFINDNLDDFKDMVYSSFGAGSALQELYISHDRMNEEFWAVLAKAAKWADENEQILMDTHWIGGSPINLEVYGFASWKPGKGILTLRNPSDKKIKYNLSVNKIFELPIGYIRNFKFETLWEDDEIKRTFVMKSNDIKEIELNPFEVIVFEAIETD